MLPRQTAPVPARSAEDCSSAVHRRISQIKRNSGEAERAARSIQLTPQLLMGPGGARHYGNVTLPHI